LIENFVDILFGIGLNSGWNNTANPPNFYRKGKQVPDLVAQGKLVKEIASDLGVTSHAIKKHVKNIYQKMQVQNRVEAVMKWRFS